MLGKAKSKPEYYHHINSISSVYVSTTLHIRMLLLQ